MVSFLLIEGFHDVPLFVVFWEHSDTQMPHLNNSSVHTHTVSLCKIRVVSSIFNVANLSCGGGKSGSVISLCEVRQWFGKAVECRSERFFQAAVHNLQRPINNKPGATTPHRETQFIKQIRCRAFSQAALKVVCCCCFFLFWTCKQ